MKHTFLPVLLCSAALCGSVAQDLHADSTKQPQLWRPTVIYDYNMMDGEWKLRHFGTNEYDLFTGYQLKSHNIYYGDTGEPQNEGIATLENGEVVVEEQFTYKPEGTLTLIRKMQYDPIVPVCVYQETWTNNVEKDIYLDETLLATIYKTEIARNEAGNITSIRSYTQNVINDPGVWEPNISWFEVEYGDDQTATAIRYYQQMPGEEPVERSSITDIVWDRTDGQITSYNYLSFVNISSKNRILSATVNDTSFHGSFSGKLTASYDWQDDDNYSYEWRLMLNDDDEFPYRSLSVSASLGFSQREIENVSVTGFDNYDEESGQYKVEAFEKRVTKYYIDLYGITIGSERKDYWGAELYNEEVTYNTIEYDAEGGYPVLWYSDYVKEVFEDSVFLNTPAGIDEVASDDTEVKYFNLQGIEVADPTAGMYIRRQGSEVTKVLIK